MRLFIFILSFIPIVTFAVTLDSHDENTTNAKGSFSQYKEYSDQKLRDLKYGTVLFDYFQQNYFASLIGYEIASERGELDYQETEARLLQGGMKLSYGLPDDAEAIFNSLVDKKVSPDVRNKAWYYLAKLYYQKGESKKAAQSLGKIKGKIPQDIHEEYNYLATLINIRNEHLDIAEQAVGDVITDSIYKPYLTFNLAASQLASGDVASARKNFKKVVDLGVVSKEEEFLVLADRAKQALAHIEVNEGNLLTAWQYLQTVRTTGLYSNRALLSYSWTAIKLEQYNQAIAALRALDKRSISIAEVQEAKVLLAHLYEQQGAPRTALKQYLLAEKSFKEGVKAIDSARKVIGAQKIPEEFVINLEAIMDESDWYGSEPSLDYNKLTPFLIELMTSNPFHIVLKELRDLYALRNNLEYWTRQAEEHKLILEHRRQGWSSGELEKFIAKQEAEKEALEIKMSEIRLHTMTLSVEEQTRFDPLIENMKQTFEFLEDKLEKVKRIKKPYKDSEVILKQLASLHKKIAQQLAETDRMIKKLEAVMRVVVNAELDKHEERMRYYWAQARLGKARLYDRTLILMEENVSPAAE